MFLEAVFHPIISLHYPKLDSIPRPFTKTVRQIKLFVFRSHHLKLNGNYYYQIYLQRNFTKNNQVFLFLLKFCDDLLLSIIMN